MCVATEVQEMLFQIDYRVLKLTEAMRSSIGLRKSNLNLADHGVTLVGRWHSLGDGTGTMIVETDDFNKCTNSNS